MKTNVNIFFLNVLNTLLKRISTRQNERRREIAEKLFWHEIIFSFHINTVTLARFMKTNLKLLLLKIRLLF